MASALSVSSFPTSNAVSTPVSPNLEHRSTAAWKLPNHAKKRKRHLGNLFLAADPEINISSAPLSSDEGELEDIAFEPMVFSPNEELTEEQLSDKLTVAGIKIPRSATSSNSTSSRSAVASFPVTPRSLTESIANLGLSHRHPSKGPSPDTRADISIDRSPDNWAFDLPAPPLPPVLPVDSELELASRSQSENSWPYVSSKLEDDSSDNASTESLLIFMHPTPAQSSSSLSSPELPTRKAQESASATAISSGTPPARDASPKPSTLPRSRPRTYASPYPYFTTPTVFASVNPHSSINPATLPTIPPPKPKAKGKASARPTTAPSERSSHSESVSDHSDRAPSSFTPLTRLNLRRMTSHKGLFRRTSVSTHDLSDVRTDEEAANKKSAPGSQTMGIQTIADHRRCASASQLDVNNDEAQMSCAPSSDVARTRRCEVAVATLKMKREVKEEKEVNDVLPKLRMLRVPTKLKLYPG
ncbi:hypothetical protein AcV7_003591 [Taiwanofungus camphoratus]|nr:hypothetical protein AcV7_003591 [Antrodia cinnamomea]